MWRLLTPRCWQRTERREPRSVASEPVADSGTRPSSPSKGHRLRQASSPKCQQSLNRIDGQERMYSVTAHYKSLMMSVTGHFNGQGVAPSDLTVHEHRADCDDLQQISFINSSHSGCPVTASKRVESIKARPFRARDARIVFRANVRPVHLLLIESRLAFLGHQCRR